MSPDVQAAEDRHIDQIVALIEKRIGEEDGPEARLVLEDDTFDRAQWSVVEQDGRVVSTVAAFSMTCHYGGVEVPATNFEFVATASGHEGRGFVRQQFEYHHQLAGDRGELVQVIVGIPYFYRTLGYEYALSVRPFRVLPANVEVTMPAGWEVRTADVDDVELAVSMQETGRTGAAVAFAHRRQVWSFVLSSPVYQTLVASVEGTPRAMGRVYRDDGIPFLTDVVARESDGLSALVAAIRSNAPAQKTFLLSRVAIDPLLSEWRVDDHSYGYYVRIGDPVGFLNAIRPELSARLGASPLSASDGDALISLYRSSIGFSYSKGQVSAFDARGPEPAPGARGAAGVPPDLFCALVFGEIGVDELSRRHHDFRPGKLRELLQCMFPQVESDVASWVVP